MTVTSMHLKLFHFSMWLWLSVGGLGDLVNDEYRLAGRKVLGTHHPSFYGLNCPLSTGSTRHRFGARPAVGG